MSRDVPIDVIEAVHHFTQPPQNDSPEVEEAHYKAYNRLTEAGWTEAQIDALCESHVKYDHVLEAYREVRLRTDRVTLLEVAETITAMFDVPATPGMVLDAIAHMDHLAITGGLIFIPET